ncbi:sporulation membrane protein YtrH [Bacillus carboniphilus]|uniref:Sporulation membrane protein YtrH n=1 Tax=Bacillus carboniphilus TaxID=86663 RepID=A0ABP3G2R9_9BACI
MLQEAFFFSFFKAFFIAFGVLVGGSMLGGFAAFITNKPALNEILELSRNLRIWAIIAAIGGTFDTLYSLEKGFMDGDTKVLFKQFLLILSALWGAQVGYSLISWFTQGD